MSAEKIVSGVGLWMFVAGVVWGAVAAWTARKRISQLLEEVDERRQRGESLNDERLRPVTVTNAESMVLRGHIRLAVEQAALDAVLSWPGGLIVAGSVLQGIAVFL